MGVKVKTLREAEPERRSSAGILGHLSRSSTVDPELSPAVSSRCPTASSFQGAAAPTGNNATSRTLVSSGTEHHPSTGGPLVLQRNQSSPAIHSDLINDESRSSSVSIDLRVSTTPNRDIRDSDKHGDDGGGGRSEVSRSPRAQHTPSVASTPMIASTSPGSAATDALSSGSSDRGRSGAGKRRMLLDADVRCAEGREHYGGSVRLEYNDGRSSSWFCRDARIRAPSGRS